MMQSGPTTSEITQTVHVKLLGEFSVSVGSRAIRRAEWRSKKAANLVKLLALAPGHRVHREQAIDLLWPDSARSKASNNLRQVLYGARRVFDSASGSPGRYVSLADEVLVLCQDGQLWVDVDAFEEAASTARRSRDPAFYRAAIELYAGELLPEDRYEEWAQGRREGLRQLYLTLLIELARLYEGRGGHALAIEALRKAINEEPALEEAHASLMRLSALSGRPEHALDQYERLRDVLRRGIGTRPTETTRRLRDEIAAGRLPTAQSADDVREVPSDAGKHNLPAARTSFIGREREILEVKRALAMTRLLTLTGAGGSGKTRLSLEAARELVGTYPDGVWLVELAPLSQGDLVAEEVAGTVGVQERPSEPLADTLVEALAGKAMLLVLDNCEHLVEEVARLVDTLLASCPYLRVVATSREPLAVAGEVNWAVPPLSLPDVENGKPDGVSTIESLTRYEAVRLFLDRARLRLPDFELTQENAEAVARVCRKLDGIPLAIELATARMGTLAVEQVAQKLEVSLDVLKGSSRSAAPRQQTLKATLDWSYDLLSEVERTLFQRVSVFAGGWSLEAAEEVCYGGVIQQNDVLDLLGGLIDKSLVVVKATKEVGVRYGMLEPIHRYAREKLWKSEHSQSVLRYHAEHYLALAEEAQSRLWGPEEAAWLSRLELEHDNLRGALAWTLGGAVPGFGLRLAVALSWFWSIRGHLSEGARWLEAALERGGAPLHERAGALSGLGHILAGQNDFERAEAHFEEALILYEDLGDRERAAELLGYLGWVADNRLDYARARVLYQRSLAAARESGNLTIIPNLLNGLAFITFESGNDERARTLWKEALTFAQESRNVSATATILTNMGYAELVRGDHEQAKASLEKALDLGRKLGNKQTVSQCLCILGLISTAQGDPQRAKMLLKESLSIDIELQAMLGIAEELEGLAGVAGALGQDVRAARLWGAAAALRKKQGRLWSSAEHLLHEPVLDTTRSRLGEASWVAAFTEGKSMRVEDAVQYALSEEKPAASLSSSAPEQRATDQVPSLTPREEDVATLVARGMTNRQVASELSISEHTAATHVRRILKKLGLQSRAQVGSWLAERRPPTADLN